MRRRILAAKYTNDKYSKHTNSVARRSRLQILKAIQCNKCETVNNSIQLFDGVKEGVVKSDHELVKQQQKYETYKIRNVNKIQQLKKYEIKNVFLLQKTSDESS